MRLIECDESHSRPIVAILNDAIATSTALYDYQPRTPEMMAGWFDVKRRGGYPVIGAVDDMGELMGFASYGPFRPFPAYKYTVEHSVYVARDHRRRGVGRELLAAVIDRARRQDYHTLVGVIDAQNVPSVALHEAFGFTLCGTLNDVGFKFGRWLDVCFYQLILTTPANPKDG